VVHMSAERRLAAPPSAVWSALNDVETLRTCISGCEKLERLSEDSLAAEVLAKVGPVSARFKGRLTLSEIDPLKGCRISGQGEGGPAGFASGSAKLSLAPDGADTVIAYTVDATIGGKLAQLGSRLIDMTARRFSDEFFNRFEAIVAPIAAPTPVADPEVRPGVRTVIWVPALVASVLFALYVISRL
jgi:uncharacterized protein